MHGENLKLICTTCRVILQTSAFYQKVYLCVLYDKVKVQLFLCTPQRHMRIWRY